MPTEQLNEGEHLLLVHRITELTSLPDGDPNHLAWAKERVNKTTSTYTERYTANLEKRHLILIIKTRAKKETSHWGTSDVVVVERCTLEILQDKKTVFFHNLPNWHKKISSTNAELVSGTVSGPLIDEIKNQLYAGERALFKDLVESTPGETLARWIESSDEDLSTAAISHPATPATAIDKLAKKRGLSDEVKKAIRKRTSNDISI